MNMHLIIKWLLKKGIMRWYLCIDGNDKITSQISACKEKKKESNKTIGKQ
jgi:hypothetical protein